MLKNGSLLIVIYPIISHIAILIGYPNLILVYLALIIELCLFEIYLDFRKARFLILIALSLVFFCSNDLSWQYYDNFFATYSH